VFCTNCGTQAARDHSFCSSCGSKLESVDSVAINPVSEKNKTLEIDSHNKASDWRVLTSAREIFTHSQVAERIKRISGLSSTGMPEMQWVHSQK